MTRTLIRCDQLSDMSTTHPLLNKSYFIYKESVHKRVCTNISSHDFFLYLSFFDATKKEKKIEQRTQMHGNNRCPDE